MKSRLVLFCIAGLTVLTILWVSNPVTALTDGPVRKSLEDNSFGERLIKASIYPVSTHDVYHKEKREFIHGIKRVNKEIIYEPDVYTWELAMAAHQARIAELNPVPLPPAGVVQPIPMEPYGVFPSSPDQIQLTPLGTVQPNWQMPAEADRKMQALLARARGANINQGGQLQAQYIKQRIQDHMGTLNNQGYAGPNPPLLPQYAPRGKAGDSYDNQY